MAKRKPTPQIKRQLWAITYVAQHEIRIFKRSDEKFCQNCYGETTPAKNIHKAYEVDINVDIFETPWLFTETLIHEFTHVLEAIWPSEHFSTKNVNSCTPLARTIGAGIGEMLTKLRQVKVG